MPPEPACLLADPSAAREYRKAVREYWEETTGLYLKYGTSFQSGYVFAPGEHATAVGNNLYLASRAGIRPGHIVLDAGCGVCGPSIDIARKIDLVRIDAVTLSPSQAQLARETVLESGLADRIHVHVCDYHQLPTPDARFDVVFFFESMYSLDLLRLFGEIRRVLRPGGRLYAKEVWVKESPLSAEEEAGLREFEDVFRYRVRTMSEVAGSARAAGFANVEARELGRPVSTEHYERAMYGYLFGLPFLTEFGRRHRRSVGAVPLFFGELRACR